MIDLFALWMIAVNFVGIFVWGWIPFWAPNKEKVGYDTQKKIIESKVGGRITLFSVYLCETVIDLGVGKKGLQNLQSLTVVSVKRQLVVY